MIKIFVKYFLTVFLSVLLIIPYSSAFHKNGTGKDTVEFQENKKKKDIQSLFCTIQVDERQLIESKVEDISNENKKDTSEKVEKKEVEQEEKKEVEQEEKKEVIKTYDITSYHGEFSEAPEVINFSILKKEIEGDLYLSPLYTVEQLLDYYCIQENPSDNKLPIYKKGNQKLFNEIAKINGKQSKDDTIEGDIYDNGIIKLSLQGISLIYAKAQFIIDEENRLAAKAAEEAEKKRIAAEKEKKRKEEEAKKIAKEKAKKKGNQQWISENKQNYLDSFRKKLNEFENRINELETKRDKLVTNYKNFEEFFNNADEDAKNAIADLVNRDNQEIKNLREKLRDNIKNFLSRSDLDSYERSLNKIEKIKFKKYKRYISLKSLINRAEKSNKAANFVGTDATKILGITIKQKKIGFIQEFKNIKDKDLGSGSNTDEKNMDDLNSKISKHKENIENYINFNVNELQQFDEELGKRIPWTMIVSIAVAVLIVIAVGVYLYFQRKQMDQLKREAEEKVGSLKNELEVKLKSTSDQIKSVSRNSQQSRQSPVQTQEVVEEKPKTQEQIIAEKYDELISDYKEALDDFSKVAGFRQKWNGLALNRKERQEGTKTILVNSSRAFEKAEIWCVTFSDKYFAFPGSTVKSNMSIYMNFDFQKADQDFKGVFAVSTGTSYLAEPSVLRRGGAGFVVERVGKLIFPD